MWLNISMKCLWNVIENIYEMSLKCDWTYLWNVSEMWLNISMKCLWNVIENIYEMSLKCDWKYLWNVIEKNYDMLLKVYMKCHWSATEICLPFSSNQWNWMTTERSLNANWNGDLSDILVRNQSHFRVDSVNWKLVFNPSCAWIRSISIKHLVRHVTLYDGFIHEY